MAGLIVSPGQGEMGAVAAPREGPLSARHLRRAIMNFQIL